MSRFGKIARRTFLIGSVAVVGGAAFGVYAYRRPVDNPLPGTLGEGEHALTPYVVISTGGITIITPRADTGQGVHSALAALVAEELDLDWGDFSVSHGPPDGAYYNSKVAVEGMPVAAIDQGAMAQAARVGGDAIAKFIGLQITGGSTSIPDGWEKMRLAGAAAREALKQAAATRLDLSPNALMTEGGAVIAPDGTRIPYTELAEAAAELELEQTPRLRDPSQWRLIGKPMPRLDIVTKSTGTHQYGIDFAREGLRIATVKTHPVAGGGLDGFVDAEALQVPGVERVVPITGGFAVLATNTFAAFKGADAVVPQWDATEGFDTETLMLEIAASISDEFRDSRFADDGDVEAELEKGVSIEAEYRVPYLAHAPLEPMTASALFEDGRLTIWASTQIPRFAMQSAAEIAGIDVANVSLDVLDGGGSFGRRLEDDYIRQVVEIAVAAHGVPIKLVWRREHDMTHDFPRPAGVARGRGRVEGGVVTAFDLDIAYPSVTASQIGRLGLPAAGPDIAIVAGAWDQPYAIANRRVTGYRAPERVPVSSWRSVGASGNAFFHECLLDELLHEAGLDPVDGRLRLLDHDPSRKVLEEAAMLANWQGATPAEGRGRGVAYNLSFGVPVAEIVDVSVIDGAIRLDQVVAVADVGRIVDPVNFESQLAGGVIWGLGHAMNCQLTFTKGAVEQDNFHVFEGMRQHHLPKIIARGLENGSEVRGIGEPGVPPAAPALANAIFAATGQRLREMPFSRFVTFA